jgi:hypothetical protein
MAGADGLAGGQARLNACPARRPARIGANRLESGGVARESNHFVAPGPCAPVFPCAAAPRGRGVVFREPGGILPSGKKADATSRKRELRSHRPLKNGKKVASVDKVYCKTGSLENFFTKKSSKKNWLHMD